MTYRDRWCQRLRAKTRTVDGVKAHALIDGKILMFKRDLSDMPQVEPVQKHFLSKELVMHEKGVIARYGFAWVVQVGHGFFKDHRSTEHHVFLPGHRSLMKRLHVPFFLDAGRDLFKVTALEDSHGATKLIGEWVQSFRLLEHVPNRSTCFNRVQDGQRIDFRSKDAAKELQERTERLKAMTSDKKVLNICQALEQGGIKVLAIE